MLIKLKLNVKYRSLKSKTAHHTDMRKQLYCFNNSCVYTEL